MKKKTWVQSAFTNDNLVAELLLRMKHSSDSTPKPTPNPVSVSFTTKIPCGWGHRKIRTKSNVPVTATKSTRCGKEHRRSPTTHLSFNGSLSDGYEDLSSGSRSVKANEVASISSCHKYVKHKLNLDQTSENSRPMKARRIGENEVQRGFVLPDLNMAPDEEEDLTTMR